MSYDPACEQLAWHFLPPSVSERLAKELAQHIQDEIEDWLANEATRLAKEIRSQ